VDVLGHHYVADDHKTVAATHFLQNLQQEIAMLRLGQQWHPPIATRSYLINGFGKGTTFSRAIQI
jgi:hypothetical protein